MKDLDFDELDKAVNSLMAGVKSDDTPASDKEKTLTIDTSAPIPSRSGMPITPLPRPAAPPVASTGQPAPAARRGGRFMDVVHPSSDMKKPEPTARPSREGVTIEPQGGSDLSSTPVEGQVASSAISPPEAFVEEAKKEDTFPVASSVQPHHETGDWPDPLDIISAKPEEPKPSEDVSIAVPASKPTEPEEPDEVSPWREATSKVKEMPADPEPKHEPKPVDDAPLVSPFLPGTKVEKRPLGANATAENVPDDLVMVDENAQLPANPKDLEPILPAELHGDVMAIEADTTTKQPAAAETLQSSKEDESSWKKPDDVSQKSVTAQSKPEGPAPAEVKREEPKITGPTSIAQQYHEEPSTGDQNNGAIYDTDTYHQPLSHPTKKKSGWMWIVWILLIVVVGAGAGAAIYFLGIV